MPIIQIIMFGFAVTTGVEHIATMLYDLDSRVASRGLVARFVLLGYFDIVAYVRDDGYARRLLDHGEVQAVLHLDKGFEADPLSERTAQLQVTVDGADSNTSRLSAGSRLPDRRHLLGIGVQDGEVDCSVRARGDSGADRYSVRSDDHGQSSCRE